jgi:S1-C subfamily serine protease
MPGSMRREANIRPPGPINKVSAREVLQLIGLDAEFRNDGWHVNKVAENSLAGRSGVRDGDVIEAIDDVKVIGNTTFDSGFNGKNLTVLRNGNRETISIRNQ